MYFSLSQVIVPIERETERTELNEIQLLMDYWKSQMKCSDSAVIERESINQEA